MTDEMRKALEEVDKPNKGGKQKVKVGPSEPAQTPKKKKRALECPGQLHLNLTMKRIGVSYHL